MFGYPGTPEQRPRHRPWQFFLVVLSFLVLLTFIAFNTLPGFDTEVYINGGWSGTPYDGAAFVPHSITFTIIWSIILSYQFIWSIYGLYTLGKIGPDGTGYLYHSPPYTSSAVYVFFILANGFATGWLIAWDRIRPDISLALIAMIPFSLYLSIIFSVRGLSRHGLELYQSGYDVHIRLTRGMIQNGMAFYATWTTIATLLNFDEVLRRYASLDGDLTATISLGILSGEVIIFLILDWCVLERYMRYIFTPYFVLVGALTGSVIQNFDPSWTTNTILIVVLLGVAALAMLVKFVLAGSRIQTQPDYILRNAGLQNRKQALAMQIYPSDVNAYGPSSVPSGTVPYDPGYAPVIHQSVMQPTAPMMNTPARVQSQYPRAYVMSGADNLGYQGQAGYSLVQAPQELSTRNPYLQQAPGTAVAYNSYTS